MAAFDRDVGADGGDVAGGDYVVRSKDYLVLMEEDLYKQHHFLLPILRARCRPSWPVALGPVVGAFLVKKYLRLMI